MMDELRILEGLDALRIALGVLREMSAQEQIRVLLANLFKQPSSQHLKQLSDVLSTYAANDPDSAAAANRVASDIAGTSVSLSTGQLGALRDFFFGAYYSPILPISGDNDGAFQEFYDALFSKDVNLASLRDLQRQVGDFWVNGTQAREKKILSYLQSLGPQVSWDSRHVFAFICLLTLDLEMKQLAPFEASGSIW